MMDGFITYLIIGVIWCFITDVFMTEMENNNTRLRYIIFWSVTVLYLFGDGGMIMNNDR